MYVHGLPIIGPVTLCYAVNLMKAGIFVRSLGTLPVAAV